jgi:DNA-binding transcriptional ArsR family regulator
MKNNNTTGKLFSGIIGLNKVIHEPARIAILSLLYAVESADFLFIMNQTGLTQGNLSFHLSTLESAGYVLIEKRFQNKRPNTLIRLSDEGRNEYRVYIRSLREFINAITN